MLLTDPPVRLLGIQTYGEHRTASPALEQLNPQKSVSEPDVPIFHWQITTRDRIVRPEVLVAMAPQCYPGEDKRIDKLSLCDEVLYES